MKTLRWIAVVAGVCMAGPAAALDVTGYSTTANDRFASGFPASPVPNTSPSFVGAAYDWSGVGWAADDPTKGFGFITPQHYLVARHYGGASTITLQGADGTLRNVTQASVTNTGCGAVFQNQTMGDLAVGKLTTPTPANWGIARYAVLDLNGSSSVNYSYNNEPLLAYGRGESGTTSPRIGAATISNTVLSGSNSYVVSSRSGSTSVQLQTGDSGSPVFIPWQNPVGAQQLTILGNNAAIDSTDNYYNYVANSVVMAALNAITTPDGYALRVQGNINALWTGATNSSISLNGNWSGGTRTDQYVGFQADGVTPASVNINTATTLRGLYFGAGTGATDGFTFSGANTLTIGRGGLTNYTGLRQTFTAPVTLGDHQYWDVGAGGVTTGAINTNGKLLEIAGSGTARITGAVSGTGGLALSGHRLELTGSSTYTGRTWVHAGKLAVNGNIAASSGVTLDAGAEIGGSGHVGAISGSGAVGPGNSPGILTATSVDAAGGLDFSFEFGRTGAPTWSSATASGNDVLRLTGGTPFTQPLTAANVIDIFLGVQSVSLGSTFLGGFFTDASADFWGSLQNATFQYYVLGDGLGTAKTYNDQGYYLLDASFWADFERVDVSTVSVVSAGFADGTVTDGRVMQLVVVPEPSAVVMVGVAVVVAGGWYRRRGRTS